MKYKSIIIALIALLVYFPSLDSKPAKRGTRIVKQPDGSELRIKVVGDEFLHFTLTEDDKILHIDENGFYTLGEISPEGYVISKGISPLSKEAVGAGVSLKDLNIETLRSKALNKRRAPQSGYGLSMTTYPTQGSPKGLIILVEYQDVKFQSSDEYDGKEYFNEMINGENFTQNGGTGSAFQYFTEQSGGLFRPEFDVYGPVTLPNSQSYYGRNDWYGNDANAHLMVRDAIQILDEDVNFADYDTDGDGLVDNVYIFYAGQGEADFGSAQTVWPHSWDLREAGVNLKVDGVTVGHYACSNEWDDVTPTGVGTFVHEFSHVLGLPDLYHTASAYSDFTPLSYSVLDYGPYNNEGRTPPNYGAFELNALRWREPIVLEEPITLTLDNISTGQFALIPTNKDTEFFLLENRQLTGWDAYIPNHGMLIWHIDYVASQFINNTVNNNAAHQYVDIVEANNTPGWEFVEGFTFPGTTGKTEFTATSSPALKGWNSQPIDLPITDITEIDGMITFDVAGGGSTLAAPEVNVNEYSFSQRLFVLDWLPVEGATDYFITIYYESEAYEGNISNGFDGSSVGSGWIATETDWYTTNSNYGESSPSYKFRNTGQTLTSPALEDNVSKISFWMKGQGSIGTTLRVEGLVGSTWVFISSVVPEANKAEIVEITEIPEGVTKVRFVMDKNYGNIAVDDIVLTYGGASKVILPDYDNVSTDNNTYFVVDRLVDDVNEYYIVLSSTDGKRIRTAEPYFVKLVGESMPTGVGTIDMDNRKAEYYTLQGFKVTNPKPGSILIEKTPSSIRKVIVK